jgi:hypothetical protein
MICKHCNTKNPNDASFCRKCGTKLSRDENKSFVSVLVSIMAVTFIIIFSISKCSSPAPISAPLTDSTVVAVDTMAVVDTSAVDTSTYLNDNSATYISASTENISFSPSGGEKTIEINTDGSVWNISIQTASWISITQSGNTITLNCQANTGVTRTDYFEVKADNQTLRIHISQSSGVNTSSATINKVWGEYNVMQDNVEGMLIHVSFDVSNMLNKKGNCNAYFHYNNGNKLRDTNDLYTSHDGQVSVGKSFTPSYDNSTYSDFKMFLPYSELHVSSSGSTSLKFQIIVLDESKNSLVQSDYTYFTYTL